MICQMRPNIRCSRTSMISPLPILTTEHPIPLAELMTILLFSVMWKAFRVLIFFPGLFSTRSSIVSGTLSFISFASTSPSLQSSNISKVSVGNGSRCPMSGSPASTALMCLVNSVRSSSLIVCVTFAEEPWTCILPPTLLLDWCPDVDAGLPPSAALLRPRTRPLCILFWAGGACWPRTLEMSWSTQWVSPSISPYFPSPQCQSFPD